VPTAPFMATGGSGAEQISRFECAARSLRRGSAAVVLIHHRRQGAGRGDSVQAADRRRGALARVMHGAGGQVVLGTGPAPRHRSKWLDGRRRAIPAAPAYRAAFPPSGPNNGRPTAPL